MECSSTKLLASSLVLLSFMTAGNAMLALQTVAKKKMTTPLVLQPRRFAPARPTPHTVIADIFALLKKGATITYGENITQLLHAEQCALLAWRETEDDEIVIAALLHDIGHLLGGQQGYKQMGAFGTVAHEMVGARYLKQCGFSKRVCSMVALHVAAKRYQVYKNPDFIHQLSDASFETLKQQGGPMTPSEAHLFEQNIYFNDALCLRRIDDRGKEIGNKVLPYDTYHDMLFRHLTRKV